MPYADKEKRKEYARNHYLKNKKVYVSRAMNLNEKARERIRKIKESSPCVDCKNIYPYYVMDFDHLRDKKFTVSKMLSRKGVPQTLKEIDKCELVCANCHRIRTYGRLQLPV